MPLQLTAILAGPAQGEMIAEPVALLQGLDKITARVSKFEAPVGAPVRFGTLSIRVRGCEKNPPEETPENAAFLEIDELRPGEARTRVFSGCSRRVLRERSMFSATRATMVVSKALRFSTLLASARLTRSQASWTASSVSLSEPSIR